MICEDSLEGIFTGIYEAYLLKLNHEQIHLQIGEEWNLRLFAEYRDILPDTAKAVKVARTIQREFGSEAYLSFCRAIASGDPAKGEAVYKSVVAGFGLKQRRELMGHLADPHVHKVFELSRFSGNEAHYLVEFLRFRELENKILYAVIAPKNNVLTFIMPHFADRFPLENFVIHDEARNLFALHPARKEWYVVSGAEGMELPRHHFSAGEKKYSELFTAFFHTIAIKERVNPKLQRNMLPIRYREYMTEFNL